MLLARRRARACSIRPTIGLALALAGDPHGRRCRCSKPPLALPDADARVRQNLALAYAFAGDWEQAAAVASQDVPADQLDARIQQWMQLAKPAKRSDQVAALIGVIRPAVRSRASRPASPWRASRERRLPQAAPAPQPAYVEAAPAPAVAEPLPAAAIRRARARTAAAAAAAAGAGRRPARFRRRRSSPDGRDGPEAPAASPPWRPTSPRRRPSLAGLRLRPSCRRSATPPLRSGKSKAVVQLGAYRSPQLSLPPGTR